MRRRLRGGQPDGAESIEQDVVIDLRERLAPYDFEHVGNPAWRDTLIAADRRRRDRPLRASAAPR